MKRSFMDRIFPHPPGHSLAELEELDLHRADDHVVHPRTPSQTRSRNSPQPPQNPSTSMLSFRTTASGLSSAPLTASLLHYDDPLLPIERTSKALQEKIQSLLDAQSAALGGPRDLAIEHTLSHGSSTPIASTRSDVCQNLPRTIPIRQPPRKKVTLRGARNGLRKSMIDFVSLREEELRLLEEETQSRIIGLEQVADLESRKNALSLEIESAKVAESSSTAKSFRSEAQQVQNEIQELEHRLLELKVRQRHLVSQAEQIESALDSKASSYKNTLSLVETEVKEFLRRPPVRQPFGTPSDAGMFALKPHRRTLQMAREQWSLEQQVISNRIKEVEAEQRALIKGEQIWSAAVQRIHDFEAKLRMTTNTMSQSLSQSTSDIQTAFMEDLLKDLGALIDSLQGALDDAQTQNWNLLVCALGAEMHACLEAQNILQSDLESLRPTNGEAGNAEALLSNSTELPSTARHSPQKGIPSSGDSDQSNQSLKDTLAEFTEDPESQTKSIKSRYESEDDEPPADFLLSR